MAGDTPNAVLMNELLVKVITPIVNAIGRQFGYLLFYNRNINNLKERVARLKICLEDAKKKFEAQGWNNKEIARSSAEWLKQVEDVTKSANEVVNDKEKLKGWYLNLKDRYLLSMKSTKIATTIQKLHNQAPTLDGTIPALPAAKLHRSVYKDASKDFETRKKVMDNVMEALKDDKINIVGICGLGGIGKTTILLEVREIAITQDLFDEVAMITVSQDPKMFSIQSQLASVLGLTSIENVENIVERADKLHKRLTNDSKILVVLDDVWSAIDLKDVCIPIGNNTKCKVVLASRDRSVCTSMGTQETISLEALSREDAWHLFKKTAGDCELKKKLEETAKKIVDECGGLPIALVTLARALSNKRKRTWEDALTRLRQSSVTSIPEMNKAVYQSIKLSYDFLATEAQSFLLICCQHEKAVEIKVEKMARYCLALKLFENVDKFVDVRNRTCAVIEHLISCFLLQVVDIDEDENYKGVKVHDVVRDVCLSILSEMKEEKKKVYMHIMAPDMGGGYELDKKRVDYSKLNILMKAPLDRDLLVVSFLQRMEKLRVFENCRGNDDDPPPAIHVLKSLRMLSLEGKTLREEIMSSIESLSRLKILSFWRSRIFSFPHQIGQLKNLKLLDLRCEVGKGLIPSGVLQGLKKLEVLCMGNFHLLGATNDKDIRNGESHGRITELDSLSNLTTLQIDLFQPNDLLDLRCFRFEKLEIFFFGSFELRYGETLVRNTISLEGFKGMEWVLKTKIHCIVTTVEKIELRDVKHWTDPRVLEKFVSLRELVLSKCNQLEYVLPGRSLGELYRLELRDMPMMTQLWVVPMTDLMCLGNLREVEIINCQSIRYIFPNSAAKLLVQLEILRIDDCPLLEGIVCNGELGITTTSRGSAEIKEDSPIDFIVMFPKLRELVFWRLPELGVFYNMQQLEDGTVQQPFLNPSVILPSLEELHCESMDNVRQIVGGGMLQLSAAGWLENLKEIHVKYCFSLEIMVDFGENGHVPTFNELKVIILSSLPKLEHLCNQVPQGVHIFQNLTDLRVFNCDNLGYLISSSLAHMLVKLERLSVSKCKTMKEVIEMDEDCEVKKIVFPSLKSLRLFSLNNLSSFCSDDRQSIEFPLLEEVIIMNCTEMKTFCCGYLTTKKLHGVKPSFNSKVERVWKGDLNQTVRHLNSRNKVDQMDGHVKEDDFEKVIAADEHTNEGRPGQVSMPLSVLEEGDIEESGSVDNFEECNSYEGTQEEAPMPLSVVSSPDASLTPYFVSPLPVSDNNEDLFDSSASPYWRGVPLSPPIEFVPSPSMEPKADHRELSDICLSSPDDDWKRNRILIQGVYVKAKLKTTFEEILMAKPNFLSGLHFKMARLKTDVIESAIRSLEILHQRTALTITSEELACIKDSLDDLESTGLDTTWLERGYKRAMLGMLKRENMEASTARRDCFKAEYGALMQELEAGKELFGDGFDSNTSLGDGLLD